MKETRYFYVPDALGTDQLPPDEAQHASRVLRLQPGDEIFLTDGCGSFHRAELTLATSRHCTYRIVESMPQPRAWHGRIHLAIGPTKMMDRMEWMVEKATEVGFDEVSFLDCQFSERHVLRADRIEKVAVAAMKQSRKAWKPVVNAMCPLAEFISSERAGRKFICHCYDEVERTDLFSLLQHMPPDEDDVTIMVGPEGDFSIGEVRAAMEHGYESVSLGSSRLRTETAGLMAVGMAQWWRRV